MSFLHIKEIKHDTHTHIHTDMYYLTHIHDANTTSTCIPHAQASCTHTHAYMCIRHLCTHMRAHTQCIVHIHSRIIYVHVHTCITRTPGEEGMLQQGNPGCAQGEGRSHSTAEGRHIGRPTQTIKSMLWATWPAVTASPTSWPPYGEVPLQHTARHRRPPHLTATFALPGQERGRARLPPPPQRLFQEARCRFLLLPMSLGCFG